MQVLNDSTGHNGLHTFRIAGMVMVIVSYQNFRCSAQEVEVGYVIYQSGRGGDGGGSCGGRVGGGGRWRGSWRRRRTGRSKLLQLGRPRRVLLLLLLLHQLFGRLEILKRHTCDQTLVHLFSSIGSLRHLECFASSL